MPKWADARDVTPTAWIIYIAGGSAHTTPCHHFNSRTCWPCDDYHRLQLRNATEVLGAVAKRPTPELLSAVWNDWNAGADVELDWLPFRIMLEVA